MKGKLIIISALVVAVLGIGICIVSVFDSGPKKDSLGIDVSHHNKLSAHDWKTLNRKGVSFVYIKASEGSTYKDPAAFKNIKRATRYIDNCKVGLYHFFRDNCNSKKQFTNFKEVQDSLDSNNYKLRLRPVIDFEDAGLHRRISTRSKMITLKRLYNLMSEEYCEPIIYCGIKHYALIKRHIPSADIWLATSRYKKVTMYQFRRRVNGKLIDHNRANITDIVQPLESDC